MKKVLLTGGSGFIGRHSIPFLMNNGYEVHAVFHEKEPDFIKNENIFWYQSNLLDPLEQKELVAKVKPSHLLHFAWYAVPGKYWTSLENFRWVQASMDLFRNFAENGGNRAVVAGTCAEYDWNYGYCSEDITPLKPSTIYGTCKNSLQQMLQKYSGPAAVSFAWGRIFYPYGPFEHPGRLVSSVICSLLKSQPALCSHGNQIRDLMCVEDAAEAFAALLESDVQGPINIASGQPIALKKIIYTIADIIGRRDLVRLGSLQARDDDPSLLIANCTRLFSELKWRPKLDLSEGLSKTIEWWKDRQIQCK